MLYRTPTVYSNSTHVIGCVMAGVDDLLAGPLDVVEAVLVRLQLLLEVDVLLQLAAENKE